LSLNHVSTAELDNIIEQLISDIYKNQKPILAHKLKEPLTNYCNSSNKTIEYLKNFGIITVEDILYHFPYKYDELSLNGSDKSLLTGICEEYKIVNTKTRKRVLEYYSETTVPISMEYGFISTTGTLLELSKKG